MDPMFEKVMQTSLGRSVMAEQKSIVVFDGVCNLCNWYVRFVIKRDECKSFLFASAQSRRGSELLRDAGLNQHELRTILLLNKQQYFIKSEAILKILDNLRGYRWLVYLARLIPRSLRDQLYDFIAQKRYAIWGRSSHCPAPSTEMKDRFLE